MNKAREKITSSESQRDADRINLLLEENKKLKKVNATLTHRNKELEQELKRTAEEIETLKDNLNTYMKFEELVQIVSRPIIDEVVNEFQNVWAQRIAMQVEENIKRKGHRR